MSKWLDKVRLVVTTKDIANAGTDDRIDLEYFLDNEWKSERLNHAWDDRERGRTEMYEVEIEPPDLVNSTDPPGYPLDNWSDVKQTRFRLRTHGNDAWLIDCYFLLGHFYGAGATLTQPKEDLGWHLMAYTDGDVWMSTDNSEGRELLDIEINGPLPSDRGFLPWLIGIFSFSKE